jgi:hypothetical protein
MPTSSVTTSPGKQHHGVIEPAIVHDRIEPAIRGVSARKARDRARAAFLPAYEQVAATVGCLLVEQLAVQVASEATESLQRFE